MGLIKQFQLEKDEREINERYRKLEQEAREAGWDIDGETYEAYLWALEKDD